MLDTHTFLMELYVMVDDFCQHAMEPVVRPGPAPSLSCSEVVTLGLFSQWQRFRSERDFYRFAQSHLRPLFPRLPHRSQFNRLLRRHHDLLSALFLQGVGQLQAITGYDFCYEALDTSAIPRVMPSGGAAVGCRNKHRLAGAIASDGLKAFACCCRSILKASSQAFALARATPKSNP